MLIPYGSDRDDGFVGYHSIAIVLLCLIGFGLTWPRETTIHENIAQDSLKVWLQQEIVDREVARDEDQPATEPSFPAMQQPGGPESTDMSDGHSASIERIQAKAASFYRSNSPLRKWGLSPSDNGWLPGIVTHMFLHAGWMHLIGNMVFFFAFGVAMERRFGWKWFLFLYLGGGIFSGLCQIGTDSALRHGLSTTPLVGASGAIAAAMGAFLRSYPTSKIKILVWFLRPRTGMLHAWIFLGGWFLVQFLHSHFGVKDPNGGVAYIAHVSGFFFGFVVAQFLPVDPEIAERDRPARAIPRTGIVSGFDAPRITDDPPQRDERPILDQAWNAVHAGFDEEAADLFTRQFSAWIRGGASEIGMLDREIEKISIRFPGFRFAPLPAWEWGMKLSENGNDASALKLLRMALGGAPPLSPALAMRAEQTALAIEARTPKAPPPLQPPRPPPAPRPPASAPGKPTRPDWMTD
ncbi:MAG: hypothetical protein RL173_2185 [Fibrobacterota bacterium]|jgi:membrane associated rhomboid family serine protease